MSHDVMFTKKFNVDSKAECYQLILVHYKSEHRKNARQHVNIT